MTKIGELEPAERTIWESGRILQSGKPRHQGLLFRELVDRSGYAMGYVAKWVTELERKGLATSKYVDGRRKKGTTRFLAPKKSN